MRLSAVLIALLVLAPTSSTKNRDRQWQTGKVLDASRRSTYAGSRESGNASTTATGDTSNTNYNGDSTANYSIREVYVIEARGYIYECSERIQWIWSKPAAVTINGPIQFAIEKDHLYIKSEDGSEHNTTITKKTLKP